MHLQATDGTNCSIGPQINYIAPFKEELHDTGIGIDNIELRPALRPAKLICGQHRPSIYLRSENWSNLQSCRSAKKTYFINIK